MSAIAGVLSLVEERLTADATLTGLVDAERIQRVPVDLEPGTEEQPYVAFDVLDAADVNFRAYRVMTTVRFVVRGVTAGSDLTAGLQIQAAIDAALVDGEADLPAYGVHVGRIYRENELLTRDDVDGVAFYNWGGQYRSHVWRL